jgi:TolA-binding protein
MQSNNSYGLRAAFTSAALSVVAVAFSVSVTLSPQPAAAQSGASGVAAAAQEAGVIFSDERIRQMAERKIRLEEMQQRIEEIGILQQLETVDAAAARQYKAQILGDQSAGDAFFEAYDKEQEERGVVLPTLLGVSGSGDNLVAQVQHDETINFVRVGQYLDADMRVESISARSIIVDLRGRKFRVSLSTGG